MKRDATQDYYETKYEMNELLTNDESRSIAERFRNLRAQADRYLLERSEFGTFERQYRKELGLPVSDEVVRQKLSPELSDLV